MTVTPNPSNSSPSDPDDSSSAGEKPERLSLSATQVAASGLAAVSATVAASYFGVAGTVIGAGLGSIISVVGGAVYTYSIKQTRVRMRRGLDLAVAQRFSVGSALTTAKLPTAKLPTAKLPTAKLPTAGRPSPERPETGRGWSLAWPAHPQRLALAAGALFVGTLAVTTGFELASGQPLAATVHGEHGSGTSIGGGDTSKPVPSRSTSISTVKPSSSTPSSSSPAAVHSSSSSAGSSTPTVTVTVTPSATPSPTGSPSSSGAPSDSSSPTG